MTMTGEGASPDVCPRAPDTLATPLHKSNQKCMLLILLQSSNSNKIQTNEDTIVRSSASFGTTILVSVLIKFIMIFAEDNPHIGR